MELILIRHAHPRSGDGSHEQTEEKLGAAMHHSPADPRLSSIGTRQAQAVARWLANRSPDRLVSSPARRARDTAQATAVALSMEVEIDDRLRDANSSRERYVALEEDRAQNPEAYRRRLDAYRDSTQLAEASMRVNAALDEWTTNHPGLRVAVFCHGSVVNVYAARVLGLTELAFIDVGYASAHRFMISRDAIRSVKSLNETAYLP
jgi:probable phosphoglycerate mutase